MKIDRRITNGLAWAGVAVVIGVPVADLISGHFMGDKAVSAPQIAVIEPATPVPAATTAASAKPVAGDASGNAVDSFVQSGRKLPSYITGGDAAPQQAAKPAPTTTTPPVANAPAPAVTNPTTPAPVDVAALPPAKVAPVPRPLSMRPKTPVAVVAPSQPPLITQPPGPNLGVTQPPVVVQPPVTVTATDLEDWESGPLSDFLARRQQQQQGQPQPSAPNGGNGFFLDQVPNNVQPNGSYVGPVTDDFYFPFTQ